MNNGEQFPAVRILLKKGMAPENLRTHPRGKILNYLAIPAIASFIMISKVSTSIAPEASSS